MSTTIPQLLGGLGLFLLGMVIMTTGLKAIAGAALRRLLTRFTRNPVTGAVTGALATATIQSSSATTVAAIGFVSAGLLTFPQALGIIFGANIGTTITGWLVALVGFKLKLGTLVLPLIFVGALCRLFGSQRVANIGMALAGFGLVFVGIGMLQEAMSGMAEVVSPESFPPDTWGGRALLVLLGIVITLLTQSSSAGVAVALAAVSTGTISFTQAAAMVIGMDVGTTATAAIATIGASAQGKRTGFAHVIYNCLTGVGAYLILPVYSWLLTAISDGNLPDAEPELSLVGFHTFFNTLGVLIVLPFTNRFAAWIKRIVPERGAPLTRGLDPVLLRQPESALDAAGRAVQVEARKTIGELGALLDRGEVGERGEARIKELDDALAETRLYIAQIRPAEADETSRVKLLSLYHAIDHLRRLLERYDDADALATVIETRGLETPRLELAAGVVEAHDWLRDPTRRCPEARLMATWQDLNDNREPFREQVLRSFASGDLKSPESLLELDAARWLERCTYHVWRVVHHMLRVMDPSVPHEDVFPPHAEPEGPLKTD